MAQPAAPEIIRLSAAELHQLLEELCGLLPPKTYQLVEGLLRTLAWLFLLLEEKTTTLARLRRLLGGKQTEQTKKVLPGSTAADTSGQPKPKPKGHGRQGARDYPGAQLVKVPHPQHQVGDPCPKCLRGILYWFKTPAHLVHIVAQPLFHATVYALERLRCALCGALFTAPPPPEAGLTKYEPSVGVTLALLRYGMGLPMYRIAKWQKYFGVPLPEATQWELIVAVSASPEIIYQALIHFAAQAQLLHHDDTYMRVQSLRLEIEAAVLEEENQRTGIFTTGLVAQVDQVQVALFFTGPQHAGENLDQVLRHRAADLAQPLVMCDALSRNVPKEFAALLANCLAHGRRQFVEQIENFPEECRHVIESLQEVYRFDALAREQQLSAAQRLAFHQQRSRPVLDELHQWMAAQLEQKLTEPNSGLGKAYNYMLKRWPALTRFLEVEGAPLDNNLVERALKMAIVHRKNSLSYKTLHGSRIGDIHMSLIHTCILNQVNPFAYAMALQRHAPAVQQNPTAWFPWNYHLALAATVDSS